MFTSSTIPIAIYMALEQIKAGLFSVGVSLFTHMTTMVYIKVPFK